MKILIHSNAPWAPTGYGQQCAQIARRFRAAGHDVAISAFYGVDGGPIEWEGFTVYPSDHTLRGKMMLRHYVGDHAGEDGALDDVLVVTLMDVWPWIDNGVAAFDGLRIAAWTPVDHDPAPWNVVRALQRFQARPVAMSRFGERALAEAGLDPLYVPHGIDTSVFAPPADRDALRDRLGISRDAFVVGMAAANIGKHPPRKAFPQVFEAFAEFRRRHDDAVLLMHTDMNGVYDGINLLDLAAAVGIPERALGVMPQVRYMVGTVTQEQVAEVYGLMDVLANPSFGEGFGVPIVEAQACGVPVIVTDWTAMPELCGAGWLVDGDRWWDSPQRSFFKCPSVSGIIAALEQAYARRGDVGLRARAVDFAAGYDADRVMRDYWESALEELDGPREVAPLDRQMVAA